jgi:hypothetical protein
VPTSRRCQSELDDPDEPDDFGELAVLLPELGAGLEVEAELSELLEVEPVESLDADGVVDEDAPRLSFL